MEVLRIGSFDGQVVRLNSKTELFEVGNFLGGGAAGTVYECEHVQSHNRFALKILNPLGYKIVSPSLLRRCSVYTKGKVFNDASQGVGEKITKEHVWWVMNESAKQYVACIFSQKQNTLKELSLGQCADLWGVNFTPEYERMEKLSIQNPLTLPTVAPKYLEFLRKRNQIFREIRNMRKISNHRNVIKLEAVLELIQESKATLFLVMELANGGELFDRIKLDCGTREETARIFFRQLVEGVKHCHDQGVCHRDLKPENLLLQDDGVNGTILKIADFGFSAHFLLQSDDYSNGYHNPVNGDANGNSMQFSTPNKGLSEESPLRILKSVVGSPFYVAPEIVQQSSGYDGSKADIWSMGVILYAMLAGNLPFGQELNNCKRFRHFCKWIRELNPPRDIPYWCNPNIEYPSWLFPPKFTPSTKGLIVSMLHPDPHLRITMVDVMKHSLCEGIQCMEVSTLASSLIPSSSLEINMRNQGLPSTMQTPPSHNHSTAMDEDLSSATTPLDNTDRNSSGMKSQNSSGVKSRSDSHLQDYADEMEMFQMEEDSGHDNNNHHHTHSTNNNNNTVFAFGGNTVTGTMALPPTGHQDKSDVQKKLHFTAASSSSSSSNTTTTNHHRMEIVDETSQEERKSVSGSLPPILPPQYMANTTTVRDLIPTTHEEDEEGDSSVPSTPILPSSGTALTSPYAQRTTTNESQRGGHLPAFHDMVKRSTRFTTTVPAEEVLLKVANILEMHKLDTPAGIISRIDLNWETFRLEIFGTDYPTVMMCALQIYQIPSGQQGQYPFGSPNGTNYLQFQSPPSSTSSWYSSSLTNSSSIPLQLLMVEFIRGQSELFAFKRFYTWVRVKLSELVRRDYAMSFFDQAGSPSPMSYFPQNNHTNSVAIPIGQARQ